jgi:hypothetical protein
MIAIYTWRDGILERRVENATKDAYLSMLRDEAGECGIPPELQDKFEQGETHELRGWPETSVTWYGRVGISEIE